MNVHILRNACGAILPVMLAACGDSSQDGRTGAPRHLADVSSVVQAASDAAALFRVADLQKLDPVKPAEVVELPLADLGLPDGADKVTATGAVTDVLLKGGSLRFSTPGDTGAPQHAEFALVKNGVTRTFALTILTERPAAPIVYLDASQDGGAGRALPALAVAGLGPNNRFAGNPLTFRLQGAARPDLAQDSDGLVLGQNNVRVSLKPYWTFHPADNSFTISGTKLQQLMAALPRGALDVSLNFVSADGEFAAVYQMLATGPGATLSGRLVTPQGEAVTGLAGKKMLLRGFDQRLREVAGVDANGNFTFTGVIPDTYQLTLSDLENPNVVSATTVVGQNATSASVTIVDNRGTARTRVAAAARR